MSARRNTEFVVFTLVGALHLGLGWHFRCVDQFLVRTHQEWPLASIALAVFYVIVALFAFTVMRELAIQAGKVVSIVFLTALSSCFGETGDALLLIPPLIVLLFRKEVGEEQSGDFR